MMLPEVNLLPKYERQSPLGAILFYTGLILCIIAFSLLIYFYFQTKGNLTKADDNLQHLSEEKDLLVARQGQGESSIEAFKTAHQYAEHHIVPTSIFIEELLALLPGQGYLNTYTYNYQSVNISTQFEQMNEAAAYVEALDASNFIKNVEVNQIQAVDLSDNLPDKEDAEEDSEGAETVDFDMIPRYEVTYSIDIDQAYLKGEGDKIE